MKSQQATLLQQTKFCEEGGRAELVNPTEYWNRCIYLHLNVAFYPLQTRLAAAGDGLRSRLYSNGFDSTGMRFPR